MDENQLQSSRAPLLSKGYKKNSRPPLTSLPKTYSSSQSDSHITDIDNMMEEINSPNMHNNDTIIIEKEAVIQVNKEKLCQTLASRLGEKNEEDFNLFFRKVESSVRSSYHRIFDEIIHIYEYFEPATSEEKLNESNLKKNEIDDLEMNFLTLFFYLMEKSNYKMVNDKEFDVATSANYLLNLPIKVDSDKLDSKLFKRFFSNSIFPLPSFAEKHLIFRRGIGVDQTHGLFIFDKIDLIITRLWKWFVNTICCKRRGSNSNNIVHDLRENNNNISNKDNNNNNDIVNTHDVDDDSLIIDRIRLENMKLSMKTLFSENIIQEPTFERMVLLYRPSNPEKENKNDKKNENKNENENVNVNKNKNVYDKVKSQIELKDENKNRSIIIKHFRHIPFADMEIVWPEKVNPGLTAYDWASFMSTVVGGLIAVLWSISFNLSWAVVYTIAVAFISYLLKIYFAWGQSMSNYKSLMQASMYDKQLDMGKGTLLHLCDDVLKQEVKEAVIAYYILLTRGAMNEKELGKRCGELLSSQFQENVKFDCEDAIVKLERFGIARMDKDGKLSCKSLKAANAIIGFTMEEAYDIFPSKYMIYDKFSKSNAVKIQEDVEEEAKRMFMEILFKVADGWRLSN